MKVERRAALKAFAKEARDGSYPSLNETADIDDAEYAEFCVRLP